MIKLYTPKRFYSFRKEDSELMYKTNVEGTKNVMNVRLNSKIKKVSYIASISHF